MDMGIEGLQMSLDMELYDYGVAVAVEAPPADQVSDLSSVLGGVGGLGFADAAA
jgi:hypothetical protein